MAVVAAVHQEDTESAVTVIKYLIAVHPADGLDLRSNLANTRTDSRAGRAR